MGYEGQEEGGALGADADHECQAAGLCANDAAGHGGVDEVVSRGLWV